MEQQLDRLDLNDPQGSTNQRQRKVNKQNNKKQGWLENGHGIYSELSDEKEFFEMTKKSPNFVCHFFRDTSERCRIVDIHLDILATKHVESKFCKISSKKAKFLTKRLRIKVIPTIVLVKDSKIKDFIVGFYELGNIDDITTEIMEKRIQESGVIYKKGELVQPPDVERKLYNKRPQKNKRRGYDEDK